MQRNVYPSAWHSTENARHKAWNLLQNWKRRRTNDQWLNGQVMFPLFLVQMCKYGWKQVWIRYERVQNAHWGPNSFWFYTHSFFMRILYHECNPRLKADLLYPKTKEIQAHSVHIVFDLGRLWGDKNNNGFIQIVGNILKRGSERNPVFHYIVSDRCLKMPFSVRTSIKWWINYLWLARQ